MSSRELGPEWVLSASLANAEAWGQDDIGSRRLASNAEISRKLHARQRIASSTPDRGRPPCRRPEWLNRQQPDCRR
jgi:hypothetical protein